MIIKGCRPNINYTDIINSVSQEDLFLKYLGIYPELNKNFYSPFRHDRSPGCRFKWYNGLLYFVENTMFNKKLYWTIFDIIQYFNGCSFKESLYIISNDFDIKHNIGLVSRKSTINERPDIRFTFKEWNEDNLFNLSGEILEKELIFLVDDYWIGKAGDYRKNCVHNPKKTITIAYYFPKSNHVKLYFPEQSEYRWYSNCDINDVFGMDMVDYYSSISDELIITKSQKDRLTLNYHLGYQSIALQNEGSYLPDDFMQYLSSIFRKIYVLFDNDASGIAASNKIAQAYNFNELYLDIDTKDVYETVQKYGYELTRKTIIEK